ncbi:hypothetical protein [Thermovenabulum sp.]|uniref:hypothetical protein n=1 Tax=Thermovenabulum sp. TaxID=3100335 RepID=UPI003C7C300A
MKEIYLNFGKEINSCDIQNLNKTLEKLEPGQEIIIQLEAADAHQADVVIENLRNSNFDLQPHGGHNGEYYIIAKKKG